MASGKVKWFDQKKGFGFITADEGADLFAHYTDIEGKGFRNLNEGDEVEFEIAQSDKGPKATQIKVTNAAPAKPAAPYGAPRHESKNRY